MKRKIKILSLLFSVVIIFAACEEEDRPYSNVDLTKADLATEAQISNLNEKYTFFVDPDLVGTGVTITKAFRVKVLGKLPSSEVTVDVTIDADETTAVLGTHYDLPNGTSLTIQPNTNIGYVEFTIYAEEFELAESQIIEWSISSSQIELDEFGTESTYTIERGCPLDFSLFDGLYQVDHAFGSWTANVEPDPEVEGGIIITNNVTWWNEESMIKLVIDDDGTISGDDQFTSEFDHYGGLGRIMFEDINGYVTDNCLGNFLFNTIETLPESGYWYGGEHTHTYTKISKKSDFESVDINAPTPLKR